MYQPPLPARWPWGLRKPEDMPEDIKRKLAYTETQVLGGQIHQAVMYRPIAITVAGLLAIFLLVPRLPDTVPGGKGLIGLIGVVGLVGWLAWKWLGWSHSLFFFTSYRIIYVHGLVTKKIAMLPMGKVTDMGFDRTPMGQLLDYGMFIIESAGQEQALRELNYVPQPDEAYRHIVDWLFGKGTQNVNIIDVNMKDPTKAVPVWVRNPRVRQGDGGGDAWWNS